MGSGGKPLSDLCWRPPAFPCRASLEIILVSSVSSPRSPGHCCAAGIPSAAQCSPVRLMRALTDEWAEMWSTWSLSSKMEMPWNWSCVAPWFVAAGFWCCAGTSTIFFNAGEPLFSWTKNLLGLFQPFQLLWVLSRGCYENKTQQINRLQLGSSIFKHCLRGFFIIIYWAGLVSSKMNASCTDRARWLRTELVLRSLAELENEMD